MKLAKKTLSVALAAIMAVSSAAVGTSAFAATATKYEASKPVYKAISTGVTTVAPEIKIDTKFAAEAAVAGEDNIANQIDATSLNNYYSFTPSRTGEYSIKLESTPLFYGYNQKAYITAMKTYNYLPADQQVAKAEEAALGYATSVDGLFSNTSFDKTAAVKATDAIDVAKITNVGTEDEFIAGTGTVETKSAVDTHEFEEVLSWKYDANKDEVVKDKVEKGVSTGKYVGTKETYLKAGTTYYFMVTVANTDILVKEDINKRTDGKTYAEAVKTAAKPTAKITINLNGYADGVSYGIHFTDKDAKGDALTQKVTVPDKFDKEEKELDVKTQKFYVEKPVVKKVATAYNNGGATTVKVDDTHNGVNVTAFVNMGAALTTLTLGKYVETVEGCKDNGVDKVGANLKNVTITNPDFVVSTDDFNIDAKMTVPANSVAYASAAKAGFVVTRACTHAKTTVVKAATVFAAGEAKCNDCDKTVAIAKLAFKPTFKAKKGAVEVKGNAGKVAKVAVWVDGKKTVKKNVTKCTVKGLKAGKHTVKVKLYGANGAKTVSVKKTVKVK